MFKKKPTTDQVRPRQRIVQNDTPRNAAVFSSYHANRSVNLEGRGRITQEEQERPKKRRAPKFMAIINRRHVMSVLVIIIVFLMTIGLSSTPKVVVVGDVGHRFALQDLSVYQQYAHQLLGKSFTNNNKLTIDADAVASQIERQFPEVHAASISLPFIGRQPTLYIQPAAPQIVLAAQNGQFILDANGRALSTTTDTSIPDDAQVPIVADRSGFAVERGKVALPGDSVAFILEVAGQLSQKQIKVENWILPAGTSQLDVKIGGSPYYVKFNLHGNSREQAGTFLALQKDLANKKITPDQYIDVRVPGRAYYQ